MNRFIDDLRYFFRILWLEIKALPGKTKRLFWNRGIKLQWNRLYVRKDEFHSSLDMDVGAMLDMNPKQRARYIQDLVRRRQIAHKRDLDEH